MASDPNTALLKRRLPWALLFARGGNYSWDILIVSASRAIISIAYWTHWIKKGLD